MLVSLAFSTSSNANIFQEFEWSLDEWQKSYPIIQKLRTEDTFSKYSAKLLRENPSSTTEAVLNAAIKGIISTYIKNIGDDLYFELVEGIDPLFRDLNPTCGTNGNGAPVKGIFATDITNTK